MHEHICIYNSPMVKLHVQINASIVMKYTTFRKDIYLLIYLVIMAQALHSTISHVPLV